MRPEGRTVTEGSDAGAAVVAAHTTAAKETAGAGAVVGRTGVRVGWGGAEGGAGGVRWGGSSGVFATWQTAHAHGYACTQRLYCTPQQPQGLKPAVIGGAAHREQRRMGLAWEHD